MNKDSIGYRVVSDTTVDDCYVSITYQKTDKNTSKEWFWRTIEEMTEIVEAGRTFEKRRWADKEDSPTFWYAHSCRSTASDLWTEFCDLVMSAGCARNIISVTFGIGFTNIILFMCSKYLRSNSQYDSLIAAIREDNDRIANFRRIMKPICASMLESSSFDCQSGLVIDWFYSYTKGECKAVYDAECPIVDVT